MWFCTTVIFLEERVHLAPFFIFYPYEKNVKLYDCLINAIRLFTVIYLSIDRDAYHRLLSNIRLNGIHHSPTFPWALTRYRAISTNYSVVITLPIMDDTRLYKYYRTSGYGLNSLVRNADRLGYLGFVEDFNFSRTLLRFRYTDFSSPIIILDGSST